MLLGLYIFRELASDEDLVHVAIYILSSIVGVAGGVAVLFNIYTIVFHKSEYNVQTIILDVCMTSCFPSKHSFTHSQPQAWP